MSLKQYAPFFREGLLYLPDATIELLMDAGIDPIIARSARRGLHLDDDRHIIGLISKQLEKALESLSNQPAIVEQLTSAETRFMLSPIDTVEFAF